jgi:hypothetical protein
MNRGKYIGNIWEYLRIEFPYYLKAHSGFVIVAVRVCFFGFMNGNLVPTLTGCEGLILQPYVYV